MAFPLSAMSWSAVCDCGVFGSCDLNNCFDTRISTFDSNKSITNGEVLMKLYGYRDKLVFLMFLSLSHIRLFFIFV